MTAPSKPYLPDHIQQPKGEEASAKRLHIVQLNQSTTGLLSKISNPNTERARRET